VRRHRCDDYCGRYRIWLWAALCWFLLSLDETSSLHEGFKEMMAYLTGTRLFGDGSIWWVIAYFFLLVGIGIRLLIDMRVCWLSSGAMIGAGMCFVLAVVAQLGWILPQSGARGVMLEEGAEMVGNLFLLLAMSLHARHVILDAEGRLAEPKRPIQAPARVAARSRIEAEELPAEDEEMRAERQALLGPQDVTVHPPHGVARPQDTQATRQPIGKPTFNSGATPQPEAPVRRKLTKSEKKALRKKLRQMARQRQSQNG
jgi:hypothetical protein